MGKKRYILKESQLKELVENKKNERNLVNKILGEVRALENGINESRIIGNAISDVLKKYSKKGKLSPKIISKLLESDISKENFISAGVKFNY